MRSWRHQLQNTDGDDYIEYLPQMRIKALTQL